MGGNTGRAFFDFKMNLGTRMRATKMRMNKEFFSTCAGSNVKVKAYGYPKP